MLSGNLVRSRTSRQRIIPIYLPREDPYWLEIAESLLLIFRDGIGHSRGEIEEEVNEFLGEGMTNLAHRGLAKLLEDRSEFEVVAEVPPDRIREVVFQLASESRRELKQANKHEPFRREVVLERAAEVLKIPPERVASGLYADLKDENRMLSFNDTTPERLVDRYNVALAQAVLLKSVRMTAEVFGEKPQRYRQLFRQIKFHRLLYQIEGSSKDGYTLRIDGPLSLFQSTTKYGLQIALFLPALLLCQEFRLDAELSWGTRREPRTFHLSSGDGLISHYKDTGVYVPPEIQSFEARFRQVAPHWELLEATEIVELGGDGVWVPDYRFRHRLTGKEVLAEVVGFWKRSSLDRLLQILPKLGPARWLLMVSDRLRVDEASEAALSGPIFRFKEIPNAGELAAMLDQLA